MSSLKMLVLFSIVGVIIYTFVTFVPDGRSLCTPTSDEYLGPTPDEVVEFWHKRGETSLSDSIDPL